MKKRVLILSTSPRQGGNSDALAASFAEGARSAGHTVSHCSLRDKSLHFCLGCLSCQETPGCVTVLFCATMTSKKYGDKKVEAWKKRF